MKRFGIFHPAAFYKQRQVPFAIGSLCPAVGIAVGFKSVRPGRFERVTKSQMKFFLEFINHCPATLRNAYRYDIEGDDVLRDVE